MHKLVLENSSIRLSFPKTILPPSLKYFQHHRHSSFSKNSSQIIVFSNISPLKAFSTKKENSFETTFRLKLTTSYLRKLVIPGEASTSSNCLSPHPRAERASASSVHESIDADIATMKVARAP